MIKDKFWVEILVEEWEATWVVEEEWVEDLEDLCEDLRATRVEETTVPHIAGQREGLWLGDSKFAIFKNILVILLLLNSCEC